LPTPLPKPARRVLLRPARALGLAAVACAAFTATSTAPASPARARGAAAWHAQANDEEARQVTLFGVIATPGGPIDPRLARVESQLRKLLPGYGFRLLDVQSKRLTAGQTLTCRLGGDFTAAAKLMHPFDENGKVQVRCAVLQANVVQLQTDVSTPPNQLFFCEKPLGDGTRLLVGIGAR
jgi:hypothetical protein